MDEDDSFARMAAIIRTMKLDNAAALRRCAAILERMDSDDKPTIQEPNTVAAVPARMWPVRHSPLWLPFPIALPMLLWDLWFFIPIITQWFHAH